MEGRCNRTQSLERPGHHGTTTFGVGHRCGAGPATVGLAWCPRRASARVRYVVVRGAGRAPRRTRPLQRAGDPPPAEGRRGWGSGRARIGVGLFVRQRPPVSARRGLQSRGALTSRCCRQRAAECALRAQVYESAAAELIVRPWHATSVRMAMGVDAVCGRKVDHCHKLVPSCGADVAPRLTSTRNRRERSPCGPEPG